MMKAKRLTEISVPPDIILKVLQELPVKSLLRFRCVSKLWCSEIDSPLFIESHQTRSHTRLGGLNILLQVLDSRNLSYLCSADPEGGEATRFLTVPFRDCLNPLQSVNGFVCLGDRIINPSTREIHVLPLLYFPAGSSGINLWSTYSCNYLGFDPSTNKFKVLNICQSHKGRRFRQHKGVQFKILTLGTQYWRDIDFKIQGKTNSDPCYIKGVIYILFRIKSSIQNVILGFEVEHEKFRIIHLPTDATEKYYTPVHVRENIALIDPQYTTIWILEDCDKKLWKKENFECPPSWRSRSVNFVVSTVHTSEILFYDGKSTLSYYDVESRKSRDCELSNFPGDLMGKGFRITNNVESLVRLKEM
ncbi:putative F-box protein At1g47790 [Cornus florida]|uniref:putative F-box protein At1g47790 n=1 Tax=Cornus florida TaxID=4283 RepID=UPI00289E6CA8|nr:putative F-box protein At1g47790 [Cornus florida]